MVTPIFDHALLKIIKITLSFPEFPPACKKSVNSINSFLRYSEFIVKEIESCGQTGHTHFWLCPPQNFWSNFNLCEFVSICQKSGYFLEPFWRYGRLKKFCNLIGWEHFSLYLKNKIFSKYGICAGTQQII